VTKCTVIAHFLVKNEFVSTILAAEKIVFDRFSSHFPAFNFNEWNCEVDTAAEAKLIQVFDKSAPLNIDRLITSLWDA
jgi:hypothetical protein